MVDKTEQTAENDGGETVADLHVDLWVRRPVCGPRTTVIDRLSALRAADELADFSVTTWPEEIALTGSNRQDELLERIAGFEDWAADRGLSLRPPFETRTASLLVGDSEDVLTTPMLLAVARDQTGIVGIYPCTDGTKTWTISEFLDGLEDGGADAPTLTDETGASGTGGTS